MKNLKKKEFKLFLVFLLIGGSAELTSCLDIDWSSMWDEPEPVIDTSNATNITCCSATLNGILDLQQQYSILAFEYGTDLTYGQIADVDQSRIRNDNTFSTTITGLTPQTIYCYRVKWIITGSTEIHYGKNIAFTTLSQ